MNSANNSAFSTQEGVGITKREYFAVEILKGLLSYNSNSIYPETETVKRALNYADELLLQLHKKETNT